jgi:hypothetical protein
MEISISAIECLNPPEVLPEDIFPATKPIVKASKISGVTSILIRLFIEISVWFKALILAKSCNSITVVSVNKAAPI